MIAIIGLLVLCTVAAYSDIRKRIIPNAVVIGIYLYGMIWSTIYKGPSYTLNSLIYCLIILLILYIPYMKDMLGAGDVKLYSIIPLYYNRDRIIFIYLLIFCIAAVQSIAALFLLPSKRKHIRQFYDYLRLTFLKKFLISTDVPLQVPDHIPMAVPMAIGIMISIILNNTGIMTTF